MFTLGFEKTAGPAIAENLFNDRLKRVGHSIARKTKDVAKHVVKNRRDYLFGGGAAGTIGTAIGVNRKKDK
jgi:hypothetical protein